MVDKVVEKMRKTMVLYKKVKSDERKSITIITGVRYIIRQSYTEEPLYKRKRRWIQLAKKKWCLTYGGRNMGHRGTEV